MKVIRKYASDIVKGIVIGLSVVSAFCFSAWGFHIVLEYVNEKYELGLLPSAAIITAMIVIIGLVYLWVDSLIGTKEKDNEKF